MRLEWRPCAKKLNLVLVRPCGLHNTDTISSRTSQTMDKHIKTSMAMSRSSQRDVMIAQIPRDKTWIRDYNAIFLSAMVSSLLVMNCSEEERCARMGHKTDDSVYWTHYSNVDVQALARDVDGQHVSRFFAIELKRKVDAPKVLSENFRKVY